MIEHLNIKRNVIKYLYYFLPATTPPIPITAINIANMANTVQATLSKIIPPPCIFLNFCFEYNIYIYMLDKKNKKNKKTKKKQKKQKNQKKILQNH